MLDKILLRKRVVALLVVSIWCLIIGVRVTHRAWEHKGPGWIYFDDPNDSEKVSESEYKRDNYTEATEFIVAGGLGILGAVCWWRNIDKEEKAQIEKEAKWKQCLLERPELYREMNTNPEKYSEEFVEWVKKNQPHLAPLSQESRN